jgi:hypothetical protein
LPQKKAMLRHVAKLQKKGDNANVYVTFLHKNDTSFDKTPYLCTQKMSNE